MSPSSNMDIFMQMNMPEEIETTVDEIKEKVEEKQQSVYNDYLAQLPRKLRRQLAPKEKFSNKFKKAIQNKK